jgi:hypothetical protein
MLNLPPNPEEVYGDLWQGWTDFLGVDPDEMLAETFDNDSNEMSSVDDDLSMSGQDEGDED